MCVYFSPLSSAIFLLFLKQKQSVQGGDKLTLSLGISTTSGGSTKPTASPSAMSASSGETKLINLDSTPTSPTATTATTVSGDVDSNATIVDSLIDTTGDKTAPISVTHFSPALNGNGLEKETLFSDSNPFTNPFLLTAATTSDSTDSGTADNDSHRGALMTDSNPFLASKFNTIGRSNPFSSPNHSKNPFLDNRSNDSGSNNNKSDSNDNSQTAVADSNKKLEEDNKLVSLGLNRLNYRLLTSSSQYLTCCTTSTTSNLMRSCERSHLNTVINLLFFRGLFSDWTRNNLVEGKVSIELMFSLFLHVLFS